jgi:hypothetical protein
MFIEAGAASLRTAKDPMLTRGESIDLVAVTHDLNMPIWRPRFKPVVVCAPGLGNHDLLL